MNINELSKSDLRYILYKKRNSILDSSIIFEENELNNLVISYIELKPDFKKMGGWTEFAMRWDVSFENGEWQVIKRRTSETKEWDAVLQYRAEIFPTLEGGIYNKLIK